MMDRSTFISASFWEEPTNCVLGGGLDEVPDLGTNGGAVIFKTSGSTGAPKWVVHEKRAILTSAKAVNEWLGVNQESKWGLALPVDHVGGFAILARVFQAGCRLAEMDGKWDAAKFQQWLDDEGVTHVSLVPTQVHDLVTAGLRAPQALRAAVVGGGRLPESLGQAARDLGWPVLASYGMTEAGSQIATQSMADLSLPFRDGNLNLLPIWKVQCDTDDRLILSGEALFVGYVFQNDGGMRYESICWKSFLTNDRAIVSGNHLKLIGRVDSLVKVLGVLVDIEAVEQRFLEVAAGRISAEKFAVIALPDSRKEHVLAAVFEGVVPNEIIEAYQETAPSLERFDKIISVEKFPRSSLGKLRRGKLREIVGQGRLS